MDKFGMGRAIEPRASLPQPAWKLDNRMELGNNEILIEVKLININLVSFNQIAHEANYDEEGVKRRIIEIIAERGKLHNPVTGTGGMFYGIVTALGSDYPNDSQLRVGDEVISLTSLSLTPIQIQKIVSIDFENAQLELEGQCILFAHSPIVRKPSDLPLKLAVSALDEAGAPCRTSRIVLPHQNVLIIGANGKIGLLCAFAAKDALNGTGQLIGFVKSRESKQQLEQHGIFDQLHCTDVADGDSFYRMISECHGVEQYDIVINCVNSPNTEMASLLAVKNGGTIFFATLSCDYKATALTAEGIGKEIQIIPYTGFLVGHSDYTLGLVRKYQNLQHLLQYESRGLARQKRSEVSVPSIAKISFAQAGNYIFASKESQKTLNKALMVSQYNSNVLIYGESGVGKEIIAKIIHQNSTRKSFPYIKINCASIPENLLESELFGYEKGAFTGASKEGKMGLWEAAQNGTLFLDEIGELPMSFQSKLLRALQEREIIRIGAISPIKVDVRIIAATNRNLELMIKNGQFREDLYYRINVFPIKVQPLRHRQEDIIPLVNFFVKKYNEEFNRDIRISDHAMKYLKTQPLKGNIRELQNLLQRLLITTENRLVEIKDVMLAMSYDDSEARHQSLQKQEYERQQTKYPIDKEAVSLKEILEEVEANVLKDYKKKFISTRNMAKALQISQPSVVRKLKQYHID